MDRYHFVPSTNQYTEIIPAAADQEPPDLAAEDVEPLEPDAPEPDLAVDPNPPRGTATDPMARPDGRDKPP